MTDRNDLHDDAGWNGRVVGFDRERYGQLGKRRLPPQLATRLWRRTNYQNLYGAARLENRREQP